MAYDSQILQNLNLSYCVKVVNFGSHTALIIPGFPQFWDKRKPLGTEYIDKTVIIESSILYSSCP